MSEIAFTSVHLPYGWLGNMSPHIVKCQDEWYRTAEALFQCMRYEGFSEVQKAIRDQKSPMSAKMVAKKHRRLLIAGGFEAGDAADLARMRECLLLKLNAHPDLKRKLLGTKDALIIEDCSNRRGGTGMIWGMARMEDGTWVGRNELGKLWMAIREELAKESAAT